LRFDLHPRPEPSDTNYSTGLRGRGGARDRTRRAGPPARRRMRRRRGRVETTVVDFRAHRSSPRWKARPSGGRRIRRLAASPSGRRRRPIRHHVRTLFGAPDRKAPRARNLANSCARLQSTRVVSLAHCCEVFGRQGARCGGRRGCVRRRRGRWRLRLTPHEDAPVEKIRVRRQATDGAQKGKRGGGTSCPRQHRYRDRWFERHGVFGRGRPSIATEQGRRPRHHGQRDDRPIRVQACHDRIVRDGVPRPGGGLRRTQPTRGVTARRRRCRVGR